MTKSKKPTLLRLVDLQKSLSSIIEQFPNEQIEKGWLPIETAPRDGTYILVCCTRRHDGSYMFDDGDYSSFGIWVHRACWWAGENGGNGEWIVYNSMVQEPRCHFEPTHWMPIPAPPKD